MSSGPGNALERLLSEADIDMPAGEFALKSAAGGMISGAVCFAALIYFGFSGYALTGAICAAALSSGIAYIYVAYAGYVRLRTIDALLPEFLSLMASNIRSGLTPDKAMLLSSRKDFGPLSKLIEKASKEAITGKPIDEALQGMSSQAHSEAFSKSMKLIVEGIRSGGQLHDLLENASFDMRRFAYLKKEISSVVMVYQLFIFSAAAFGAPLLYGVTNFLLVIIEKLRTGMHFDPQLVAAAGLSFGQFRSTLDPGVIFLFSIAAIFTTVLFGCMAGGIISKGREIEGLKYLAPLMVLAYAVFFGAMLALQLVFSQLFRF